MRQKMISGAGSLMWTEECRKPFHVYDPLLNIAVSMDVSEMFPQVIVRPQDRDYMRFLFKEPSDKDFRIFRHKRLAFGLACSPFIAQYTVQRTAEMMKDEYETGYEVIKNSRYVDDALTSLSTIEEAVKALIEANANEIAAIIVEPVAGNMGCVPPVEGFLEGLRSLCDQHKSVLIC